MPTVTNTNEQENSPLKWILYGPPGTGKTRMISTLPNPVIMNFEGAKGETSLKGLGLPVVRCDKWQDLKTVREWCETPEYAHFDWVVIDSISKVQEMFIQEMFDSGAPREFDFWGTIREMTDYFFSQFFAESFKKNVLLIARFDENKKEGESYAYRYIPKMRDSKQAWKAAHEAHSVFASRTFPGTPENPISYKLQTRSDDAFYAKVRTPPGVQLEQFVEPDLSKLIEVLNGPQQL